MADWVVPILVAVIGGPLVVLVQQFRRESSQQHGVLAGKIDKIADKLDDHIEWHLTKTRKKKNEDKEVSGS
jgi:hypothetical protein